MLHEVFMLLQYLALVFTQILFYVFYFILQNSVLFVYVADEVER